MNKNIEDLIFGNDQTVEGLGLDVDGMQLVDIDLDGINEESKQDAFILVENLSKLYCNEEFIKNNPSFKKRVDAELESLRVLIKMRKTDEVAHDLIIKAITGNSSNASLYRSLSEIQKTILSITTKMGEIISGLNALLKNYQLELNFENEENLVEGQEEGGMMATHRGSKEFIESMINKSDQSIFREDMEEEKEGDD